MDDWRFSLVLCLKDSHTASDNVQIYTTVDLYKICVCTIETLALIGQVSAISIKISIKTLSQQSTRHSISTELCQTASSTCHSILRVSDRS